MKYFLMCGFIALAAFAAHQAQGGTTRNEKIVRINTPVCEPEPPPPGDDHPCE